MGHSDIVWGIRLHPDQIKNPFLASVSADGSVKIWDTRESNFGLKSTIWYNGAAEGGRQLPSPANIIEKDQSSMFRIPTCLDWCPNDPLRIAVGYQNSIVKIFDIETGKETMRLGADETFGKSFGSTELPKKKEKKEGINHYNCVYVCLKYSNYELKKYIIFYFLFFVDNTLNTQINSIIHHPTLPLIISAHEDRYLRFLDPNSGKCVYSMAAHADGVSTLDIDPMGLIVSSAGKCILNSYFTLLDILFYFSVYTPPLLFFLISSLPFLCLCLNSFSFFFFSSIIY